MDEIDKLKSSVKVYRAFDIRLEIEAFIAKIFDMLTTAEGLNSWWTDNSKTDPREGGKIEYVWKIGGKSLIAIATYRNFILPHYFEVEFLEWIDETGHSGKLKANPYDPPVSNYVQLQEKSPQKTTLSLMTSGMKYDREFDKLYEETYQGWVDSLANLKSVCETGKDLRSHLNK